MHIKAKHTDEPKPVQKVLHLECPQCDYTCKQSPQLRSHYITQHLSAELKQILDADLNCTVCKKQFKSRAAFMYHCVSCLPQDVKGDAVNKIGLCLD